MPRTAEELARAIIQQASRCAAAIEREPPHLRPALRATTWPALDALIEIAEDYGVAAGSGRPVPLDLRRRLDRAVALLDRARAS